MALKLQPGLPWPAPAGHAAARVGLYLPVDANCFATGHPAGSRPAMAARWLRASAATPCCARCASESRAAGAQEAGMRCMTCRQQEQRLLAISTFQHASKPSAASPACPSPARGTQAACAAGAGCQAVAGGCRRAEAALAAHHMPGVPPHAGEQRNPSVIVLCCWWGAAC